MYNSNVKYVNLGCHNIQLGHLYIQTALAGLGVSRFELSCFTNGMNFKFGTCSKLEDHLGKLLFLFFLENNIFTFMVEFHHGPY